MNVLIYILFLRFNQLNRIKQDYILLNLQYVGERKRMEEVKRLYEEIRSVRNDLKNHFVCIDLLAKQEKCEEIREYIRKFSQETQSDRMVLFTGNDTLDAILNTKMSFAEQRGIRCVAEVTCTKLPLAKADKSVHGLGTKNIRKIVEKYSGMMEYREYGNMFLCDILIPFDTRYDG